MLKKKLSDLPALPGVYLFKNHEQTVIYIGKAKILKNRVSSYFKKTHPDWKTDILVPEIADLDFIITKTETEALLLEAELVRTHQPKFNILLKDGHPFVYILVGEDSFKITRNKKERGIYFGPFLYKGQARAVYNALLERLNLWVCNKKIPNGCLQYHLGRCAGSCKSGFDRAGYVHRLHVAREILAGKSDQIQQSLVQEIRAHSKIFEFEKAQKLAKLLDDVRAVTDIVHLHFSAQKFDREITGALRPEFLPDKNLGSQLAQLLGLDFIPHTIDCFDISHTQGRFIVGSCVRFVDGIPDKNSFRKFNIRSLVGQDDYAALQEIVGRRYKNNLFPDLILIDGGKGQLHAIQKIIPGAHIISLAKREETVFSAQHPEGIKIDCSSPAGRALIALRDYAHHVAITYHRYKRKTDF